MNLENQNLIGILGIQNLPDEQKVTILEKATDLVQKRLLLRFHNSLAPTKQEEFKKLLDGSDENKLNQFMLDNASNFDDWVREEILVVKQKLAGLFS